MDTRAFLRNERTQRDRALLEADPVARQKELEARVTELEQEVQRLLALVVSRERAARTIRDIAFYTPDTHFKAGPCEPLMLGRAVNQSAHDFVLVKS